MFTPSSLHDEPTRCASEVANASPPLPSRSLHPVLIRLSACLLALLGLAISPAARAQCGPQWLPGEGLLATNGRVIVTFVWDQDGPGPNAPKLVVGGNFTFAGTVFAKNIATWDLETGEWSALGSGVDLDVTALCVAPNGDLIVGGYFRNAGGVQVNHIARWNGTSWSAFGSGLNSGPTEFLYLPNGDLVVGGYFTTAGGLPANRIARWDGETWSTFGSGMDDWVGALAVLPNGDIVAGGSFMVAGGKFAARIARWDSQRWHPISTGMSRQSMPTCNVRKLVVLSNGDFIAAGAFDRAGDQPAKNIARWDGATWSSFGSGLNGEASIVAVLPGGDLAVCGPFFEAGGVSAWGLARWNGSEWSAIGTETEDTIGMVYSFTVLPNGDILALGSISEKQSFHRWNGSEWSLVGRGISNMIESFALVPNGELIVGGRLKHAGGQHVPSIARWNGSSWKPLGTGFSQDFTRILAIAVAPDQSVYAAGSVLYIGGVLVRNIARFDPATEQWSPVAAGLDGYVYDLEFLPNGDLLAAGGFPTSGSIVLNNVARWNGTEWSPLGSGMDYAVSSLAVYPNGDIIAGGSFSRAGGAIATRIARWNGSTWSRLGGGINPGIDWWGDVYAIELGSGSNVFAAGYFGLAGSNTATANNIARWNGTRWNPLGLGVRSQSTSSFINDSLKLPNGDLIVAGYFNLAGNVTANNIARWNGSDWSALGSGVDGGIAAVAALPNGELAVGGSFIHAGDHVSAYFARYSFTGIPTMSVHPEPNTIDAGQTLILSSTPSNGYSNVSARWYKDGVPINDGPAGASPNGGTVTGSAFTLPSPTDGTPAVLIIDSARRSDAGNYTVVFSNPCGSISSNPATVTIRPGCPADIDNNSSTDLADFFAFLNCYDAGDPCADIDETPGTDLADFFLFFASYDAGC